MMAFRSRFGVTRFSGNTGKNREVTLELTHAPAVRLANQR